jgi:hypothetical protein
MYTRAKAKTQMSLTRAEESEMEIPDKSRAMPSQGEVARKGEIK